MSNPLKNEDWVCPKCGSDDCECYDNEFDFNSLMRKMTCKACDHTWREYFIVRYDGYADESGVYDKDGVIEED